MSWGVTLWPLWSTRAHLQTHSHKKAHKVMRLTELEWTTMKDLKATGSYLTNLKVNDFSINVHPRWISLPGIGILNSVTCMNVKCMQVQGYDTVCLYSYYWQVWMSSHLSCCISILLFWKVLLLELISIILAFRIHLLPESCYCQCKKVNLFVMITHYSWARPITSPITCSGFGNADLDLRRRSKSPVIKLAQQ